MIRSYILNMKKILKSLIAVVLVFSLASCNQNNKSTLDGSLESILTKIYQSEKLDASFRNDTVPDLVTTAINSENVGYYLGLNDTTRIEEAIASESTWSTSAYSVVLVRVKANVDINQLKNDIKNNVDPFKWVCVGVDESNVIVDNIGDIIILVMCNYNAQKIHQAFKDISE